MPGGRRYYTVPMRADHDTGYKQIFSHPQMMRDLLRAFMPQPWAQALELAAFERVNASYVGGAGAQRHDDMVWRLRAGGECVYVYLLLEFQSSDDRWMALRMQVYVCLLYQDLVKRRKLGRRGKLPPVLPIVLYGGERPWRASRSVSGLVLAPPEGLELLQPEQHYLLIDHHRSAVSAAGRNLVAALFGLQHSRSRQACSHVVNLLTEWTMEERNLLLRDSLSSRISRAMQHKLGRKHNAARTEAAMKTEVVEDKEFDSWEECLYDLLVNGKELLREDARKLWISKGLEEGRAEGIKRGLEKGRAQGLEEGREQGARDLLRRLLARRADAIAPEWARRIDEAGQTELERWIECLCDGASPTELFGGPRGG
jgi:predicted transposase YdaD